jgi:hypothetical protein
MTITQNELERLELHLKHLMYVDASYAYRERGMNHNSADRYTMMHRAIWDFTHNDFDESFNQMEELYRKRKLLGDMIVEHTFNFFDDLSGGESYGEGLTWSLEEYAVEHSKSRVELMVSEIEKRRAEQSGT